MDTSENILNFFSRVTETQTAIECIQDSIFKRILLFSLLDTLSNCAFPTIRSNRSRFINLIDDFSGWPDKDRYSLQQLKYCLEDIQTLSKYSFLPNLISEVNSRLQQWPKELRILFPNEVDPNLQELLPSIVGDIDIDVDLNLQVTLPSIVGDIENDVDPRCQGLQPSIVEDIIRKIDKVRYPSLVWVVRNFGVHELSHPGGGVDFEIEQTSPYYHHLINYESQRESWELYFPIEFVSKLVKDIASNLQQHFLQNNINPYNSFDYRDDWYKGT